MVRVADCAPVAAAGSEDAAAVSAAVSELSALLSTSVLTVSGTAAGSIPLFVPTGALFIYEDTATAPITSRHMANPLIKLKIPVFFLVMTSLTRCVSTLFPKLLKAKSDISLSSANLTSVIA